MQTLTIAAILGIMLAVAPVGRAGPQGERSIREAYTDATPGKLRREAGFLFGLVTGRLSVWSN